MCGSIATVKLARFIVISLLLSNCQSLYDLLPQVQICTYDQSDRVTLMANGPKVRGLARLIAILLGTDSETGGSLPWV